MPDPQPSSRKPMIEIFLTLAVGMVVGFLFSACKLPLPAPPAIAGVVGIVGIYLGAQVWPLLANLFS